MERRSTHRSSCPYFLAPDDSRWEESSAVLPVTLVSKHVPVCLWLCVKISLNRLSETPNFDVHIDLFSDETYSSNTPPSPNIWLLSSNTPDAPGQSSSRLDHPCYPYLGCRCHSVPPLLVWQDELFWPHWESSSFLYPSSVALPLYQINNPCCIIWSTSANTQPLIQRCGHWRWGQ